MSYVVQNSILTDLADLAPYLSAVEVGQVADDSVSYGANLVLIPIEEVAEASPGTAHSRTGQSVDAHSKTAPTQLAALESARQAVSEDGELECVRTASAIHRGTVLVTTQNGRLDYFGTTARQVTAFCNLANRGILLSEKVFTDPATQEVLRNEPAQITVATFPLDLPGCEQHLVQSVVAQRSFAGLGV